MSDWSIVPGDWSKVAEAGASTSRDRFRHNLARLMSERSITQASLARTMEVSRVAVHAWIWGTCFPETSRLIKLAQALGVSVGSLLDTGMSDAVQEHGSSTEEALLLSAFRKLPSTARRTLLAGAHELSAQLARADIQPTSDSARTT